MHLSHNHLNYGIHLFSLVLKLKNVTKLCIPFCNGIRVPNYTRKASISTCDQVDEISVGLAYIAIHLAVSCMLCFLNNFLKISQFRNILFTLHFLCTVYLFVCYNTSIATLFSKLLTIIVHYKVG